MAAKSVLNGAGPRQSMDPVKPACAQVTSIVYAPNLSQSLCTAQSLVDGPRKGLAPPMKCALIEMEKTCRYMSM